ncbi:hypothetical protein SFRURICE_000185 [Spodoptera frugiperda]|uniref:SFRICE_036150 n=1 Tax=Spodoptera frugiperda TaxID=7108 RepID=A0A2H1VQJ2_SPOFR|nr:hypothetical protein SFRURICE_000185 [Spodoptera frugiperda]
MAVLIYTFVTLLLNSECWNPEHQKCQCEECKSLCSVNRTITPSVILAGMDPLARLMEGAPLPGVLGATRDARPRGALVHASLAAAPAIGDKKGRHLTGTFCLTGDTMEGIIQCLVFLKAFSYPKQIYVRIVRAESYRDQEKGHQNESKYDQSESSKLSSSTIVESANLMEAEALEPEMEMVIKPSLLSSAICAAAGNVRSCR